MLLLGLVVLIVNLAIVAGAMWVGYRLVVSAVRTAILEADDERAARRAGQFPACGPDCLSYSSDSNR